MQINSVYNVKSAYSHRAYSKNNAEFSVAQNPQIDKFQYNKATQQINFTGFNPEAVFWERNRITKWFVRLLSRRERKQLTENAVNHINGILKNQGKSFDAHKLTDDVLKFSDILRRCLRTEYGRNCAFVSIGQEPAVFAEVMKLRGMKTAICPISGLFYMKDIHEIEQQKLNVYLHYLKDIGLDPKKIKKSSRNYVFCDYTDSGNSLKNFEKLLKANGYDLPNVKFVSMQDVLYKGVPQTEQKTIAFIDDFLRDYVRSTWLKEIFSPTFALGYGKIENVYKYANSPDTINYDFNRLKFLIVKKVISIGYMLKMIANKY